MKDFYRITHSKYENIINIFACTANICNYQCKYCSFSKFINKKQKNIFLNLSYLENFLITLYKLKKQDIYIELIGGEPTLDKQLIQFSNNIYKYYPNIRVGLYTNFSQDIFLYQQLIKNNVNITITWHSQHNDIFNTNFIDKLKMLPESSFSNNVDIHVMFEYNNIYESISMFKILKEKYNSTELRLLDHDFLTKQIYFLDNAFYTKKQLKLYSNIINKYPTNIDKTTIKITKYNGTTEFFSVNDIYTRSDFYMFKNWICDAGYKYMYIDINGNIYPCLAYCEEKTNIIGNIFNINDIMFKKHICKFEKCPCVWEAQKTTIQQYIKNKKYIL